MTIHAAIGYSQAGEAREAGKQAAAQALEGLGAGKSMHGGGRLVPAFGWLISSDAFVMTEVLDGAAQSLGGLPLLGFSSSHEITPGGRLRRSVVVALLSGEGLQARARWWGDFAGEPRSVVRNMLQTLTPEIHPEEHLLVAADGIAAAGDTLANLLSGVNCRVGGCLSGGELWRGRTTQVGGRSSGSGGLAAATLSGDVVIGQGAAHGWQAVGSLGRITTVQQHWIRRIDARLASEVYADLFGSTPAAWSHPPLKELVRIYPLGVQQGGDLLVRSPLHMEADGSLRMNSSLSEGAAVDILVGSPDGCRRAAADAARQALAALGPTRPRLAVLLVDAAWHVMFELEPQAEVEAVRSVIGTETPVIGGYTFGQIYRRDAASAVEFLNQHILVLLFGSRSVEAEEPVV